MHLATCPTCGTTIALDFIPMAGLIRCHTCDKAFSPSGMPAPEPENAEECKGELDAETNGRG